MTEIMIDLARVRNDDEADIEAQRVADVWIEKCKTGRDVLEMLYAAWESAVGAGDHAMARPACHETCYWCCSLHVDVLEPEAELLVEVAAKMDPVRQARLWHDTRQLAAKVGKWQEQSQRAPDAPEWAVYKARAEARIPCPFLDQRSRLCTVYQYRPFSCRSHHSRSVKACKSEFYYPGTFRLDHYLPEWTALRAILLRAAVKTLKHLGLNADMQEMSITMLTKKEARR